MAFQNKKSRIPKPLPPGSDSSKPLILKSSINPLAKAMEKRSTHNSLTDSNSNEQPETWLDEKKESVSLKQHCQNKTEQEMRKEQLFAQLKQTEDELVMMKGLLEKREKLIKEADEESAKENEANKALSEGGDQSEKGEKITKKTMRSMRERMQEMRDKLHKMNNDTDHYLADIENTMHYLDTLEVASHKLGPLSAETRRLFGDADDEEIIAKIGEENKQPTDDATSSTKGREGEDGEKDKVIQEDEEIEEKDEEEDAAQVAKDNHERMLKFFMTERTNVTAIVPPEQNCDSLSSDDDDGGK